MKPNSLSRGVSVPTEGASDPDGKNDAQNASDNPARGQKAPSAILSGLPAKSARLQVPEVESNGSLSHRTTVSQESGSALCIGGPSGEKAEAPAELTSMERVLKDYRWSLPLTVYRELKQQLRTLRAQSTPYDASQLQIEMQKLHHALIKNISVEKSQVSISRDLPRVPTEIAIHWIAALAQLSSSQTDPNSSESEALNAMKDDAVHRWLTHDLQPAGVEAMLSDASRSISALSGTNQLQLAALAKALDAELGAYKKRPPQLTRQFDNIYGRRFETALVDHLVRAPAPEMLNAMSQLGDALCASIERVAQDPNIGAGLHKFQEDIKADSRFWMPHFLSKNPSMKSFMALNLPEPKYNDRFTPLPPDEGDIETIKLGKQSLQDAFRQHPADGIDCVARPYFAVKLMNGLGNANIFIEGKGSADTNYTIHFGKQNTARLSPEFKVSPKSDYPGITLAHQPPAAKPPSLATHSVRPAVKNQPVFPENERVRELSGGQGLQGPTEEQTVSQQNGVPYVSGVSGSTNLLIYYAVEMQDKQEALDVAHIMLCTIMFLNYDGGHSIHEALWTLNQTDGDLNHRLLGDANEKVAPSKFTGNYEQYFQTFAKSKGTNKALSAATNYAIGETVAFRKDYIAEDALSFSSEALGEKPSTSSQVTTGSEKPQDDSLTALNPKNDVKGKGRT